MKLFRRAMLAHRGWRYRARVDPDEIRWMRSVLAPGDVAIDVGAYKGGYTYLMRRLVGAAGAVLSIEPQPELAAYLRRCVDDFRWTNVRIAELALSTESASATLRLPGTEPSPAASLVGASLPPGGGVFEVRTETLDRVVDEWAPPAPVRLIKCDVEGHELEVFAGGSRTIGGDRPLLLFECEARHLRDHAMVDVFEWLERLGYQGSFFWRGERRDVAAFDVDEHQVEGRRPYGNNFVFVPEEAAA